MIPRDGRVFETHIVRSGEVLEGEEVFEAKGTKNIL